MQNIYKTRFFNPWMKTVQPDEPKLCRKESVLFVEKVCSLLPSVNDVLKEEEEFSLKSHFKVSIRDTTLQVFLLNRRQSIGSGSAFCFLLSVGRW